MDPAEDDDTRELSEGLSLIDELHSGMAARWRRLAVKVSRPQRNLIPNCQTNANDAQ
jgi:hypothetical protein